jgi:hypothetical protein
MERNVIARVCKAMAGPDKNRALTSPIKIIGHKIEFATYLRTQVVAAPEYRSLLHYRAPVTSW